MKPVYTATIISELGTFFLFIISVQGGQAYPINASIQAMIIVAVPAILARARIISLSWVIVMWLFFLNFLHLVGVRFAFYDTIWWWDIITHSVTVALIAIFLLMLILLAEQGNSDLPPSFFFLAFFVMTSVICLGVLWEILEFFFDNLFTMHMQYSLGDTIKDLTVDVLAGSAVVVASTLYFQIHSKQEVVESLEAGESLEKILANITYA